MHRLSSLLFVVALCGSAARADDSAIGRAVAAPTRSAPLVARDPARHPVEELTFFGITPASTVVEVWPGGGYWTEILAPLLHDHGTYYAAMGVAGGNDNERAYAVSPKFRRMLDAQPAVYDRVRLTELGAGHPDLAPPGSADVVVTFRNLHTWMSDGDADEVIAAMYRALRAGGLLGIEEHRANVARPQDPQATNGYVREDYAIALIERAGFRLVGRSDVNANPRDTADWPDGVWTLPPTYRLGDRDRAKYQAIGEADNFVLLFRKD